MRATYDLKLEAIDLYREHPASVVKEMLGLEETPRTIQRWAGRVHGRRPTVRSLYRHDVLRTRVMALMVAGGLHDHYCSVHQGMSFHPCLIRELARDQSIGSLVFVCSKCSTPGDC